MNYPLKITPEQYWSVQFSMLQRLSWVEMPIELRTKVLICMAPLPGYFNQGETDRYLVQIEGSRAEAIADLQIHLEKTGETLDDYSSEG